MALAASIGIQGTPPPTIGSALQQRPVSQRSGYSPSLSSPVQDSVAPHSTQLSQKSSPEAPAASSSAFSPHPASPAASKHERGPRLAVSVFDFHPVTESRVAEHKALHADDSVVLSIPSVHQADSVLSRENERGAVVNTAFHESLVMDDELTVFGHATLPPSNTTSRRTSLSNRSRSSSSRRVSRRSTATIAGVTGQRSRGGVANGRPSSSIAATAAASSNDHKVHEADVVTALQRELTRQWIEEARQAFSGHSGALQSAAHKLYLELSHVHNNGWHHSVLAPQASLGLETIQAVSSVESDPGRSHSSRPRSAAARIKIHSRLDAPTTTPGDVARPPKKTVPRPKSALVPTRSPPRHGTQQAQQPPRAAQPTKFTLLQRLHRHVTAVSDARRNGIGKSAAGGGGFRYVPARGARMTTGPVPGLQSSTPRRGSGVLEAVAVLQARVCASPVLAAEYSRTLTHLTSAIETSGLGSHTGGGGATSRSSMTTPNRSRQYTAGRRRNGHTRGFGFGVGFQRRSREQEQQQLAAPASSLSPTGGDTQNASSLFHISEGASHASIKEGDSMFPPDTGSLLLAGDSGVSERLTQRPSSSGAASWLSVAGSHMNKSASMSRLYQKRLRKGGGGGGGAQVKLRAARSQARVAVKGRPPGKAPENCLVRLAKPGRLQSSEYEAALRARREYHARQHHAPPQHVTVVTPSRTRSQKLLLNVTAPTPGDSVRPASSHSTRRPPTRGLVAAPKAESRRSPKDFGTPKAWGRTPLTARSDGVFGATCASGWGDDGV